MFYSQIRLLYLGGPEFCKEDLQSSYSFGNVTPLINVTICGVPAPTLQWRFHNGVVTDADRKAGSNSYTYEYLIQLPRITQRTCGRELWLNATGYNTTVIRSRVFSTSCKY